LERKEHHEERIFEELSVLAFEAEAAEDAQTWAAVFELEPEGIISVFSEILIVVVHLSIKVYGACFSTESPCPRSSSPFSSGEQSGIESVHLRAGSLEHQIVLDWVHAELDDSNPN
jgi:hypothetical protein